MTIIEDQIYVLPEKIQQMFLFQFKPKDEKVSFGVNFLNIMIVRCNGDAMIPPLPPPF